MAVKQCRAAAVTDCRDKDQQQLNCGLSLENSDDDDEDDAGSCHVKMNQSSHSSVDDDLLLLLPKHWTSLTDSQVHAPQLELSA